MPVKGHDDGNNLHDVYTTNEVLSILQQAIDNGSMQGIDPSINPVVESIREAHSNNNLTFWQGTEAEFNALGVSGEIVGAKIDSNGKIYVLTGDTTLSDAVANAAAAAQQVLSNKVDTSTFNSFANSMSGTISSLYTTVYSKADASIVNSLQSDYYTFKNAARSAIGGTVLFSSTEYRIDVDNLNDSIGNYDYLEVYLCDTVSYELRNPSVVRIPVLSNSFSAPITRSEVWDYNGTKQIRYSTVMYTFFDTSMINEMRVVTRYSSAQYSSMADLSIDSSHISFGIYKVVGYKRS